MKIALKNASDIKYTTIYSVHTSVTMTALKISDRSRRWSDKIYSFLPPCQEAVPSGGNY